jgi:hypothetical protein
VFLYFYGLERRIIIDAKKQGEVSDREFADIGYELYRLLAIYGHISSFGTYGYRLLEWMKLLRPQLVEISNEDISRHGLRILFSIMAGKLVRDGKSIPAEMAIPG